MNICLQGSSQAAIKKSYRKLSLILHPDKETGNEKAFMKLTKGEMFLFSPFLTVIKEVI
jgi:curved DNA-binding protein CbpA